MAPDRPVTSHRSMALLLFRVLERANRQLGSQGDMTGPGVQRPKGKF